MPATTAASATLRAAWLALLAAAATACDGGADPVAPDAGQTGAVTPGVETPAGPDFLTAGTGPRILFSSARTGGTDLYRMAPDGTGLVRVTSFAGAEQSPAWSWDNQRIAMVRHRTGSTGPEGLDVFLMNADGTGKHWARPAASFFDVMDPAWSRDGTRLAVTVRLAGGRGGLEGTPYLAIMHVSDGSAVFVNPSLGGPIGSTPSFDATGTKLVFAGALNRTLEIINADGTGLDTLMGAGRMDGSLFFTPSYSPDGKRIVFAGVVNNNCDIYVLTPADGTVKRLTTNAAADLQPSWSSDGTRIAFVSNRSGQLQVWRVPSQGGTQVRLTNTSVQELTPAWSH